MTLTLTEITFQDRIGALRETKMKHTVERQAIEGSQDMDDFPVILPPEKDREVVETISGSGVKMKTVRIKGVQMESNDPSGGFYGSKLQGENFGRLLKAHPVYIDPVSSLAGAMMVFFSSYQVNGFRPPFLDFMDAPENAGLKAEREKYQTPAGFGAAQHFVHDLSIGLELGWGGLLDKIRHYREVNAPQGADLYDGLEAVVLGMQNWISRHAEKAQKMAETENNPILRENLEQMAKINERLISEPPQSFRQAVQWMLWFQLAAKMFNTNGALGRMDKLLLPYYERDKKAGILTDEEAVFHIACFLERETPYIQVGGVDQQGNDDTNPLSFLILEAAHRIKITANIAVMVGEHVNPDLLHRGIEIQFEDKIGFPKFICVDTLVEGYTRNGYPLELARQRTYGGCHWLGLPGTEYSVNDCIKIHLGVVLRVALQEILEDSTVTPCLAELWRRYERHLRRVIEITAHDIDLRLEYSHRMSGEMVLNLCCHGPIERGLDVSHGGVDYYNIGVDATGLATVADSFAALEQRIEKEKRITWQELKQYLDTNWAGADGERARLMMKSIPHYGAGGTRADDWAVRISASYSRLMKEKPTTAGAHMLPGIFSWALTLAYGKALGATPDGRHDGDPINQGANPYPGFREDGAPTALAIAVASVQSGYGNPSPMQIDFDPGLGKDEGGLEAVETLIKTHFALRGTEINMNVMDADMVREANKDPSKYPNLIVRVTGFSAYFIRLSPEFRQMVVDRIIDER